MKLEKAPKTRLSACLFLCILILVCPVARGGESYSQYKLNKDFFISFGRDFNKTLFSPADWNKKDLFLFSSVVGTGLIL
ncbi:MAG: hypothetical protein Q9M37_09775, partial [Desulfonauticus sp.]|nr:hypothetical protein [Desulfonauticus sp.]